MKTIYFKSTTDGNSLPNIELSQPCKPGSPRWNVAIFQINNVPEEMDWYEVKRLFQGTVIVGSDMFEFDFSELGIGKILMPKNLYIIRNEKTGEVREEKLTMKELLHGGRFKESSPGRYYSRFTPNSDHIEIEELAIDVEYYKAHKKDYNFIYK